MSILKKKTNKASNETTENIENKETEVKKEVKKDVKKEEKRQVKQKPASNKDNNKDKKNKKSNIGDKLEHDKSEIAKDLNIRISSPYGYYPDDVDPILLDYKNQISNLSLENKRLAEELDDTKKLLKKRQIEMNKLKMQVQFMDIPVPTADQSADVLSRLNDLTSDNQQPKPKINLKLK